jgi:hypothetical protein
MALTGRCYCGAVKYEAAGEPRFRGQCHCRECQYISGGAENLFMIMAAGGFRYTEGEPKRFTRSDLEGPGTREFCAECGTHLATRSPRDTSVVVLKVGTLDDPAAYGGPQAVIWTVDAQPFHLMPEGVAQFPRFPGG